MDQRQWYLIVRPTRKPTPAELKKGEPDNQATVLLKEPLSGEEKWFPPRAGDGLAAGARRMSATLAIADPSAVEPPFVPRPEAVLTTTQVARWLQISETQVRRLNLPCIEVGRGRFRYVAGQVLEAMRSRASK